MPDNPRKAGDVTRLALAIDHVDALNRLKAVLEACTAALAEVGPYPGTRTYSGADMIDVVVTISDAAMPGPERDYSACAGCGNPFPPHRSAVKQYCSRVCQVEAYNERRRAAYAHACRDDDDDI